MKFKDGHREFCDAKCHNSKKKTCSCVCGGALHGKGEEYAKANAATVSMQPLSIGQHPGALWLNPRLVKQPRD